MASFFGLGRNNSLDVADQRPGVLPRPSTLARIRPKEPKWLPSDDWRLGIGQFLTASPLQIACLGAAVANGGRVVSPFLVKPATQPVVKDLHIRKSHLDELRRGMELVTANQQGSTAKLLVLEGPAAGIKVAAKTGTSEWGSSASREAGRTPDHAWMVGYAPANNPTVAFAVYIHSGTSGGQASSAVIKKVLERYFTKYGRSGHAQTVAD
jgi:cell division protein FtsI/penicillin-binding protein 2